MQGVLRLRSGVFLARGGWDMLKEVGFCSVFSLRVLVCRNDIQRIGVGKLAMRFYGVYWLFLGFFLDVVLACLNAEA